MATGVMTGLTAAAAAATLEVVFWRKQLAVQYIIDAVHQRTMFAAFGLHLLITTALLLFAACLVRFHTRLTILVVVPGQLHGARPHAQCETYQLRCAVYTPALNPCSEPCSDP